MSYLSYSKSSSQPRQKYGIMFLAIHTTYIFCVPWELVAQLNWHHFRLTPESPRLLLTLGKVEEAEKVIRKIKKMNNDEISEDLHEELVGISKAISSPKKSKVKSVMASKRLTFTLLMCALVW